MTPECAKELLDLIMLDDYVSRRKALDLWSRRWVVVLEFDHSVTLAKALEFISRYGPEQAKIQMAALQDKLAFAMLRGEEQAGVRAVGFTCEDEGSMRKVTAKVGILLRAPKEVPNAVQD